MPLLEGKKAIVTGGTAGIGRQIALAFAEEGADVAIFGTNAERGAEVVKEMQTLSSKNRFCFVTVDIASTSHVKEGIEKAVQQIGPIDILVNNAGITKDGLLMRMTEEDWDVVVDVNLKSVYNTCKELVRPMMKARKGKIINVSSVVGLIGNPGQANYAASKAGMIGFTKALAKELGSRNVCVNCIAPGFIVTRMTDALTEGQKEALLKTIPMERLGDPKDIANAALFLASHLSDYMTGQVLVVDGGMVM
ncbi:MAG: 3-oxoacyl-[acyl-carrier-protein] reductase protein FabG [Chlamydiota bacterium]|jgi:3-oxoacyl-[acyl-carrier protein] reductase